MKRNDVLFAVGAIVMTVALTAALALIGSQAGVEAGPLPAPTPVVTGFNSEPVYYPVKFFDSKVIKADTGSTLFVLPKYEALDIMYVIDQPTSVNTTTLKLQHSNDGTNWTDGMTIVSNNADDATGLNQFTNFGIYTRVYADVTNTEGVTMSVIGVAK